MDILDCSMPFDGVSALEGDRIFGGVDKTRVLYLRSCAIRSQPTFHGRIIGGCVIIRNSDT